jgi:DNA-binding LacI/PurR family transcriptional regulator
MREPTMADVANHLGVSRQLVSIALRDVPGASDETRARVRKAAKELGYRPHQGARMLRQYRRRQVGVSFAPANASDSDIVEAIYSAVTSHRLQVVLSARTRMRTTEQSVDELLEYRCAALILIGPELGDRALRALAKRAAIPLVAVDHGGGSGSCDVVRSAGDIGIEMLVRYLAGLGHRKLTYIDAPAMPPAANRLEGYLRAVREIGAEPDVISVAGADYTEEAGASAGRELLARPALPTGVLACNDQVAVGALQVLSRAGIHVPADVSLTGFDDSRFASLSSIDLTTAGQDPHELGQAAVAAAVRRVTKPTLRPALHVIEPDLVVRGSTGRPRKP